MVPDGSMRIKSNPTCARARLDVAELAEAVQEDLAGLESAITVAVMGCEVNGPGEAAEADVAIIGTPAGALLFVAGERSASLECRGVREMAEAVRKAVVEAEDMDGRPSGG